MLSRLRSFIRKRFTRLMLVSERAEGVGGSGERAARTRKRKYHRVAVPPSERFVWAMVLLLVALVGVIVLEAVCIVVTGAVNGELLSVVTGLVGALVAAFVVGKRS